MSFLECLDDSSLLRVLSFLPPKDTCVFKELNRYTRNFHTQNERDIWESCLSHSFGIDQRQLGHWGGVGAKELCVRFHEICSLYGSIGYRMIRVWDTIYGCVGRYAQPVRDTLMAPETSERIAYFNEVCEARFGFPLPMELACLYSVCGGQSYARLQTEGGNALSREVLMSEVPTSSVEFVHASGNETLQGVFSGMKVYHDEFSLSLLPLESALYLSILSKDMHASKPKFLIALNLYGVRYKHMYLDPFSQQVQFDPKAGMSGGIDGVARDRRIFSPERVTNPPPWYVSSKDQIRRVSPNYPHYEAIVSAMGYAVYPAVPLVHWLECYARALETQTIQYHLVPDLGVRMLWRFPMQGPECQEHITRGISIKSSCVLVPHAIQSPSRALVWAYSIRMRLLSVEEQREQGSVVDSSDVVHVVRLQSRYWKITSANRVDEVEGDGVIGQFPTLTQGGPEYEYQSYTSIQTEEHYAQHDVPVEGWMEGYFTFVNASDHRMTGSEHSIRAICPTMHLTYPDIVL